METIKKNLALFAGGALLAAIIVANSVGVFAMAVPPQGDPTDCPDCQTIQDDLDAAYLQHADLVFQAEDFSTQMEGLLDRATTNVYDNDPLLMEDNLDSEVMAGHLLQGTACMDESMPFAYYSSFEYGTQTYCFENEDMWYGVEPNYFNFFDHMMYLSETWDPGALPDWQLVWDEWIEILMDHDEGGEIGLTEIAEIINQFIQDLIDCEDANCPEVECPDCESIADDLETALDDLELLEIEVEALDIIVEDIEDQIDTTLDQLEQWDQLKADFEAMVEDAGGQHGEDCDDFEVQSGQAWGIAHNFGDVQWCFTSEGQIEEMIQNLDEYWETHSSSHLPSQSALNQQLDDLMNSYFDALEDLEAKLDEIDAQHDLIDDLSADLQDCLDELQALQDLGECLDQDIGPMQDILDEANGEEGWDNSDDEEEPAEEEPAADDDDDDDDDDGPGDIGGHWAEDFLKGLFDNEVMTGDGDTGNMRPNDNLNRAEAAKLLVVAEGDMIVDSFFDVFFDVTVDDWFWSYVLTAYEEEYFEGYDDGSFGPGKPILRAEAVAVVLRALGFNVPGYTSYSYSDITGDEWYADLAELAFQCGLVQGRDGAFEGGETITRAEIAKILWLAFFESLMEDDCAGGEVECPDCDAVWDEVETLGDELDELGADVEDIWDQMQELEDLQQAFRDMVEDAGGMTGEDCDGFEVGSGQAWGVANAFGDVEFCLTSESQIQDLTNALGEYWENNSSSHLPSEEQLNADMDAATQAYSDKLDEYLEKLAEYEECLDELEALQADGQCLDE